LLNFARYNRCETASMVFRKTKSRHVDPISFTVLQNQ
jgi:hypothetical protein